MNERHSIFTSGSVVPASKVADQLRAHARLCRQIAEETWDERVARELSRLADRCLETANNIDAEPCRVLN